MSVNRDRDPFADADRLQRSLQLCMRRIRNANTQSFLTNNQEAILDHLERYGSSTPGQIAEAERQQPQSLTRTFNELESSGFIVRTTDPRDRRQSRLDITRTGRLALARHAAESVTWLATVLEPFSRVERSAVATALEVLDRIAEAQPPRNDRLDALAFERLKAMQTLIPTAPRWTEHAIFWHVYPLGFAGADMRGRDRTPTHRLRDLISWLDHIVQLGCNGLMLGPIFASSTHGYDTIDYFRIDERLGDEQDLRVLVDEAHKRGIRVVLDGVFNHVGRDYAPLQTACTAGPDSPEAHLFRLDWRDGIANAQCWEGHDRLVQLNHQAPEVIDIVAGVMAHWLEFGIDGWRLDAAYSVSRGFWSTVASRIEQQFPDAWIFGEMIHGDYVGFIRESELHATTQYELWKAIWSSINDVNYFELTWALDRHNDIVANAVPLTFVGNHDTTRITSMIRDARHREHALAVLFTVGGVPTIYYGDEYAFVGEKGRGEEADFILRPALPPASEFVPDDLGRATMRLYQDLIGLRRRHAWLHHGRTKTLQLATRHLAYEVFDDQNRVIVGLNLGDDPFQFEYIGASTLEAGDAQFGGDGMIIVPPHGWAIVS